MKSVLAMYGAHNSPRIVAQSGTFTVWGSTVECIEEIATQRTQDPCLHRLKITGPRTQMFDELRMLGFKETMLFPELPTLGKELRDTEGWR